MKRLTEGRKMFASVMVIFIVYATFFILFEDYDRHVIQPLTDQADWHLLGFTLGVMALLVFLLHRYARSMDRRIDREQAQRENEMRRQLTQNIAHELKTPVASIMGFTETLLDNPQMTAEMQHDFIRRSHEQAIRLSGLLQDISTLNRIDYAPEMIQRERTDLVELVDEIKTEVSHQLDERRMAFRCSLPTEIPLSGNRQLLYSALRNLVDNAINYAGNGTKIELAAQRRGSQWHFTFSDNGAGVAAEHLPHLFERFYRIDKGRSRQMGGTGLGLAIVKNAIQLHGGTIEARLPAEGGLAFNFTLPALP